MPIITEKYGNTKNILLNPRVADVREVQVQHSGYLKAGAILGASTDALLKRDTKLSVVKDNTAQCVLLNDLKEGETNGVAVFVGTIDSSKIDEFDTNVPVAVRTALKRITFVNGGY